MAKLNYGSSRRIVSNYNRKLEDMMTGLGTWHGATILDYFLTQSPHAQKIKSLKFGEKRTQLRMKMDFEEGGAVEYSLVEGELELSGKHVGSVWR